MRRKRYQRRHRRRRGRGILPYIRKNNIHFGGKLQKGDGILSGLLAKVIPLIDGVI